MATTRREFFKGALTALAVSMIPIKALPKSEEIDIGQDAFYSPEHKEYHMSFESNALTSEEFSKLLNKRMKKVFQEHFNTHRRMF